MAIWASCSTSPPDSLGAHPKSLPFIVKPADDGDALTDDERVEFTDRFAALLHSIRYFDFLDERVYGWPESDPEKRYWYATYWSGTKVIKSGGAVTYQEGSYGSDNNGITTSPFLEGACYDYLLTKNEKVGHLVRRLLRGTTSWIMAMEKQKDDPQGAMLARAAYPEPIHSTDGGRDIFFDTSMVRPGGTADTTSTFVEVATNPYWGDIWIKNNRSKDDIGHMLRAMAQVDSCAGQIKESGAENDFDDLWRRYGAWARQVEDDNFSIATYDTSGTRVLTHDVLANFLPDLECNAELSLHLVGRGATTDFDCGNGYPETDATLISLAKQNGDIVRSFHEAVTNWALLRNQTDLAKDLVGGMALRIGDYLAQVEAEPAAPPSSDPRDLADLIVYGANTGVPLTWHQIRWLKSAVEDAITFYTQIEQTIFHTFDDSAPDGDYYFLPVDASMLKFHTLGPLLGLCAAQFRNSASKPLFDCARLAADLRANP